MNRYSNIQKIIGEQEWKNYKLGDFSISNKTPYHNNRYSPYTELDFLPIEHEPIICANFNCGKHLSLQEQLFSNFCTNHNGKGIVIVGGV